MCLHKDDYVTEVQDFYSVLSCTAQTCNHFAKFVLYICFCLQETMHSILMPFITRLCIYNVLLLCKCFSVERWEDSRSVTQSDGLT